MTALQVLLAVWGACFLVLAWEMRHAPEEPLPDGIAPDPRRPYARPSCALRGTLSLLYRAAGDGLLPYRVADTGRRCADA